jgi:hypothetical protein
MAGLGENRSTLHFRLLHSGEEAWHPAGVFLLINYEEESEHAELSGNREYEIPANGPATLH